MGTDLRDVLGEDKGQAPKEGIHREDLHGAEGPPKSGLLYSINALPASVSLPRAVPIRALALRHFFAPVPPPPPPPSPCALVVPLLGERKSDPRGASK